MKETGFEDGCVIDAIVDHHRGIEDLLSEYRKNRIVARELAVAYDDAASILGELLREGWYA